MRKIMKFLLLLILFFPLIIAKADKCDFKTKSEYSKLARNVKVSYDIVENGYNPYILIKVFNIVDGLNISYTKEGVNSKTNTRQASYIGYYDATDGVYEIKHDDIYDVYKYKFTILAASSDCTDSLKVLNLTIPMYNKYSELDECQFYDVHDYLYCQEWVTSKIKYNEAVVVDKINQQRNKLHKTSSTMPQFEDNDDSAERKYQWLLRLRMLIIIGLSIGIVVDIAFVIWYIPRLKDAMRFNIEF